MGLDKKKLAIFISGQGTNLEVILQNKEKWTSLFVVSSNPTAFGLQRAANHGVDSMVLDKPIDWGSLQQELQRREIDCVFLAGFMKIVPASFVAKWTERLFNLHPSMLPKYKGLKAIEKAYAAKDAIGVTIHKVVPEVDSGEILMQEVAVAAEVVQQITLQEAIKRTQQKEHELVQKWVEQTVPSS